MPEAHASPDAAPAPAPAPSACEVCGAPVVQVLQDLREALPVKYDEDVFRQAWEPDGPPRGRCAAHPGGPKETPLPREEILAHIRAHSKLPVRGFAPPPEQATPHPRHHP